MGAISTTLTAESIEPLLRVIERGTPEQQISALRLAVRLPLEDNAGWWRLTEVVRPRMPPPTLWSEKPAAEAGLESIGAIADLVHIPTQTIRDAVCVLLADGTDAEARAAAKALAEARDQSVLVPLLRELSAPSTSATDEAAAALSFLDVGEIADLLSSLASAPRLSGETRFWLAFALARSGFPDRFLRLLRLPGESWRYTAGDEAFDSLVRQIRARKPFGDALSQLWTTIASDPSADSNARALAADAARNETAAAVIVDGRSDETVARWLRESPFDAAGRIADGDVDAVTGCSTRAMKKLVPALLEHAELLDRDARENACAYIVPLVIRRPDVEFDAGTLLTLYRRAVDKPEFRQQIAWIASRGSIAAKSVVLDEIGLLMDRTDAEAPLSRTLEFAEEVMATESLQRPPIRSATEFVPSMLPQIRPLLLRSRARLRRSPGRLEATLGAASPRTAAESDPETYQAYAALDAPQFAVAGEEIEVMVGLAATAMPGGGAMALTLPRVAELSVRIVASGFTLRAGEANPVPLHVSAEAPYPNVVVHLTPDRVDAPLRAGTIQLFYSFSGQTIGFAACSVLIVQDRALLPGGLIDRAPVHADVNLPTGDIPADLTIHITVSGDELTWTLSPEPFTGIPPAISVVGKPGEFLRREVVDAINSTSADLGLEELMRGIGSKIADKIPAPVWEAIHKVAAAAGRRPSILILSQEPYIPWELALVDDPWDPEAAEFLAAQAVIGRWILAPRRPRLPPPATLSVDRMTVISGIYDQPDYRRLIHAEEEAAALAKSYRNSSAADAKWPTVQSALDADPHADVLHFAVHGIYNPESVEDGIVLTDRSVLQPLKVRGMRMSGNPLVFLNACQVGAGNQLLGDSAGIAEAFLFLGATAVIAPLWSVDDVEAREIALDFYRQTLREGDSQPPAEVVRRIRAKFGKSSKTATCLAYQFFGHPHLLLHATQRILETTGVAHEPQA